MMTKLTISVKESKVKQLIKYLNQLDYVKVEDETEEDFVIPEWHKKIVAKRLKNFKPAEAIEWKDAFKKLSKKTGK